MTERKSSYLTGLSLANQYAAANAFKGNAGADFGAMLMFRDGVPFGGYAGVVSQFLCGNLQAVASNNTKGWALLWLAGAEPTGKLELLYGDSSLAQQTVVANPLVPTPMAQRSMLVHVFLLSDPGLAAPNNVTALIYVNGALAARFDGLSQTPADGTGTFRFGGGSVNGSTIDAPGIGVSGFGYCSSIAGASLAAKLATVQAMVDATLASTLATGDVADDALITNLFSVRRELSDPQPVWIASKGPINLARVGSSSLAVEAGDPLFGDVPFGVAGGGPVGPLGLQQLNVRTPANGGSDVTGNGSAGAPFATPQHALDVLGRNPGVIHMGSGTYQRALIEDKPGPVVFVGDGGGDPLDTALTVVIAPQAAAALTVAGLVVGAGFGAGNEGDEIEFLTGAAAGQRRTIVSIEGGGNVNAIPAANFNPAPAPGDSFRVVRSAVLWNGQTVDETWIQGCGAASWVPGIGSPSGIPTAGPLAAVYFCNVALAPAAGRIIGIKDSLVVANGLELSTNVTTLDITGGSVLMGADSNAGNAGQLAALLGLASATKYAGYTLTRRLQAANTIRLAAGGLFGYVQGKLARINSTRVAVINLLGGETGQISGSRGTSVTLAIVNAPRLRVAQTGGTNGFSLTSGSLLDLQAGVQLASGTGTALLVGAGSSVVGDPTASVTTGGAGTACDCTGGGICYLLGSPAGNWVGGGADFRVSAAQTQPGAFFAAVGTTLASANGDGSIVTRIV